MTKYAIIFTRKDYSGCTTILSFKDSLDEAIKAARKEYQEILYNVEPGHTIEKSIEDENTELVAEDIGIDGKELQLIIDTVDESVIEYIALSIMALKLTLPENITSKLPKILNKLNIYALNKTVLEIAHDELGNYMEDDKKKSWF